MCLLRDDLVVPDQSSELVGLGLDELEELFGRARDDVETLLGEALAHVGRAQRARHLAVNFHRSLLWQTRRPEDAEPGDLLESGIRLRERRQVRELRRARLAAGRD